MRHDVYSCLQWLKSQPSIILLTLTIISLSITLSSQAAKSNKTILWPQANIVKVAAYSEYLIDKTGTLNIADVSQKHFTNRFQVYPASQLKLQRTPYPVWIKFSIKNTIKHIQHLELGLHSSTFDQIDIYQSQAGSSFTVDRLGEKHRSADQHPISTAIHKILLDASSTTTFYLRLQNGGSLRLGMSLSKPRELDKQIEIKSLYTGLYYGICLSLLTLYLALFSDKVLKIRIYYLLSSLAFLSAFLVYDGFIKYWFSAQHHISNLTVDASLYFYFAFICLFSKTIISEQEERVDSTLNSLLFTATAATALGAAIYTLAQQLIFDYAPQGRTTILSLLITICSINFIISIFQNQRWPLRVSLNLAISCFTLLAMVASDFIKSSYRDGLLEFRLLGIVQLCLTTYILAGLQTREFLSKQKNSQKQDLNRSRDVEIAQLASSISSNIRTPLSGVTGMVDLLKTTLLNEQQMHCVKIIEKSSREMIKVIDDAADFNSINIDKIETKASLFNLENCIINACHSMSIATETQKLELIHIRDPELSYDIYGNEQKTQKIIIKLLNAAIERSRNDEIHIRSQIKNSSTAGIIRISIEICYRENMQDHSWDSPLQHLIDRPEQPDPLRDLEVCKRIIKHLGGKLTSQQQGDRTRFHFHLDVQPGPLKPSSNKNTLTDYRCLLIGPSNTLFEHLVQHLEYWKMTYHHISNLEHIDKDLCAQNYYDCAIIDLDEPAIINGLNHHFMREFQGLLPAAVLLSMSPRQPLALNKDYKWLSCSHNKPVHISELKSQLEALVKYERQDNGDYISLNPNPRFDTTTGIHAISGAESIRVLVAEDNLVNRQVTKSLLSRLGAQASFVVNGAEAMIKLCEKNRQYDIVFMDVEMPEMSGYEATEKIRQYEKRHKLKTIPIVAITAHASEEYRDKAKSSGMTGFINKPISLETLRRELLKLTELEQASNIAPARTLKDL